MSRKTTLTVEVNDALNEFVHANIGADGDYENAGEYLRDLIRRDKQKSEQQAFERLRTELQAAFAAPESAYKPLTAEDVITRNQG